MAGCADFWGHSGMERAASMPPVPAAAVFGKCRLAVVFIPRSLCLPFWALAAGICGFQRDRSECFCHRPVNRFRVTLRLELRPDQADH